MTMRIWDPLLPFLGSSERGTRRVSPLGWDCHGCPPVCMGFGESRQGRVFLRGVVIPAWAEKSEECFD